MNQYEEALKLLNEQVGNKDGLISLSTIALGPESDGKSRPAARIVDAYYEDAAGHIVCICGLPAYDSAVGSL